MSLAPRRSLGPVSPARQSLSVRACSSLPSSASGSSFSKNRRHGSSSSTDSGSAGQGMSNAFRCTASATTSEMNRSPETTSSRWGSVSCFSYSRGQGLELSHFPNRTPRLRSKDAYPVGRDNNASHNDQDFENPVCQPATEPERWSRQNDQQPCPDLPQPTTPDLEVAKRSGKGGHPFQPEPETLPSLHPFPPARS